jgi:hypothetical protein
VLAIFQDIKLCFSISQIPEEMEKHNLISWKMANTEERNEHTTFKKVRVR